MTAIAGTPDIASFRLRLVPLLVVAGLGFGIPGLASLLAALLSKSSHLFAASGASLSFLYVQHGLQLALALLAIAFMKRRVPADYGLHWPRGRTYIGPAILWGIFFGILMLVVGTMPDIVAGSKPALGYPLTRGNVMGWLFFEGVYVGPSEEIPFRSLLVTYLAATMPGRLTVGRFTMNWAGVIVAVIFALLHAGNFWVDPWPLALGQQVYAFALGVLYAYMLEKSKSVVAPIVTHNVGDGVSQALLFLWVAR